jgi:hypothetical protein
MQVFRYASAFSGRSELAGMSDAWLVTNALAQLQGFFAFYLGLIEMPQHHQDKGAIAEPAAPGIMGAVYEPEVAVDVEPVVVQQLLDMVQRRVRQPFRQHLRAASVVGLNYTFNVVRLLEKVEHFPVKLMGSRVLPAAVRPQPQAPESRE